MGAALTAPAAVSAQKQAEISESSVSRRRFTCPPTTQETKQGEERRARDGPAPLRPQRKSEPENIGGKKVSLDFRMVRSSRRNVYGPEVIWMRVRHLNESCS